MNTLNKDPRLKNIQFQLKETLINKIMDIPSICFSTHSDVPLENRDVPELLAIIKANSTEEEYTAILSQSTTSIILIANFLQKTDIGTRIDSYIDSPFLEFDSHGRWVTIIIPENPDWQSIFDLVWETLNQWITKDNETLKRTRKSVQYS